VLTVTAAHVVLPDGVLSPGTVTVEGDQIVDIAPGGTPGPDAAWLVPGLVDIHVHGGGGGSYSAAEPSEARRAAACHLRHGTTSAVASLVTASAKDMRAAVETVADLCEDGTLAGIHLEGPFLARVRCGAHDPALLRDPDRALLDTLLDAGRGHVRQVTVAPELTGALPLIHHLRDRGVRVAVGHTDASHTQAADGFTAGATIATHLFNGMRPLHHRDPGPVAAALTCEDVICEVIADGVHLDDATVAMLFATIGAHRIALITDAMAAAGHRDGTYVLGGREVHVENGVARTGNGALAGSTATLVEVLRRTVGAGVPVVAAVRAATLTPARAVGIDAEVGSLAVGKRADLLVLDSTLTPVAVMRSGEWSTGAGPPGRP
jgi:N-acetylglucosamine-6-phosphate deacetylase